MSLASGQLRYYSSSSSSSSCNTQVEREESTKVEDTHDCHDQVQASVETRL